MKHLVEVEKEEEGVDGRPSVGPAYRNVFAKDGFPSPKAGLVCCWDIFWYLFLSGLEYDLDDQFAHRIVMYIIFCLE